MYVVEISEQAYLDLFEFEEACEFYPPAVRFTEKLLKHLEILKQFPRIGAPVLDRPNVHRIIFGNFKVFYKIMEKDKRIES